MFLAEVLLHLAYLHEAQVSLACADAELYTSTKPLGFYQHVSSDEALREASSKSEAAVDDYEVDCDMRLDLFKAKQAAATAIASSGHPLNGEDQRLVEHMLRDGIRAGLALGEAERLRLADLHKELKKTCSEFMVRVCKL